MNQSLLFVAGLPRSGSTLLMNLLGQNPAHHVTPTSGLVELFVQLKNRWPEFIEFKAEGLEVVKPRILGALKGLLGGYFEQELSAGKTVFDKSRGWLQYIEPLEEVLGRPVKVLVPVRDVRAVVASFEKIYRNRSLEYREPSNDAFFQCQTIQGRAEVLLSPKSVVGLTIARLRDALARGVGNRLLIVPYRALTTCPQETLSLVHSAMDLPQFDYDPQHVVQLTQEDDYYHGMSLHTVRNKVEPPVEAPWRGVLPESLCQKLAAEYADINRLAEWREATPRVVAEGNGVPAGNGKVRDRKISRRVRQKRRPNAPLPENLRHRVTSK